MDIAGSAPQTPVRPDDVAQPAGPSAQQIGLDVDGDLGQAMSPADHADLPLRSRQVEWALPSTTVAFYGDF